MEEEEEIIMSNVEERLEVAVPEAAGDDIGHQQGGRNPSLKRCPHHVDDVHSKAQRHCDAHALLSLDHKILNFCYINK